MMNLQADMTDLWTYLASSGKPVVMYGMGNGADKIISVLDSQNIPVSDFFASDGFVRGHSFRGKKVLSYSQVREKYGKDLIVLVSFGTSRPEVLENIYRISLECETYAPDVPVVGAVVFDRGYYLENLERIEAARELFADARSKEVFDLIIEYKLTGRIDPLRKSICRKEEVFGGLLKPGKYKKYIDLGAYTGDTIKELYGFGADPVEVIALEPDARNYRKLTAYAEDDRRVTALNIAAWSEKTTLLISGEGNRNSGIEGAKSSKRQSGITADALDNIDAAYGADYIKYDVEGCEREALLGSENIIRRDSPDLLVSAYHRNEDIFDLPALVKKIDPEYKLYLRRFEYIPAWDLNLIAVKQ